MCRRTAAFWSSTYRSPCTVRQRGTSVSSISARSYDTPSEASLTYAGRAGKKNGEKKVTKFFNLATFFFLSYKRNYLEIFMLPTLNPPPPPWAWVTFPAVFQLPRHSECQQPDPRSSMRHFRTFPSHGITAEDSPVSRTRRSAHETTSEDLSVSRTRRSAHETTSEDPSVSRTRRSAHETTSEDPPVSRMRRLAHETTSEDPSVSRTRRLAQETTSEDPPVSRMRLFAHETTSEDPPVSRTRRLAHETTSEGTDKPFLYQSYLLATLVHLTSPSCTKNSHTVSLGLLIFLEAVLNCLFEG